MGGAIGSFTPFSKMKIANETSQGVHFAYYERRLDLFGKHPQTDFSDVIFSNPLLGIRNTALYPPYGDDHHATWVFEFQEQTDRYHTYPCEYSQSSAVEIYDCELDLSFSTFGIFWLCHEGIISCGSLSWFGSISFDLDTVPQQAQSADGMAFELF